MALFSILLSLALVGSPSQRAAASGPRQEEIVTIRGSLPPAARPELDRGPADPEAVMERMTLPLRLRPGAENELARLLEDQQNPSSLSYHRWLTPEDFGRRFGASDADMQLVLDWLSERGFRIDEVARGRGWITFSGTVRQVEEAFRAPIRKFERRGKLHQSNAAEIALPLSIARLLGGPVPLDNFHSRPMHRRLPVPSEASAQSATPLFNSGSGAHYVAPADFATIYDVTALHSAGVTGAGVKIAVAARSNIHISDVQQFRSQFGLPPNDPHLIVNGTDPGIVNNDEESEAELDAEWSGAVAPAAEIDLVITKDTDATDGISASAQYIVDKNLAQVITVSFGLCEQFPETVLFNALWSQAAAQGISVFVSSGDDGVAGCEDANATTAVHGASANGLCSTPFSVCVGGTQFLDVDDPGAYWAAGNDPVTEASALSYIPEKTWNESGGTCGPLCASGGGASTFYSKPSWQSAPGVPSANHRYVPDISINAATHDAYLTIVNGMSSLTGFGGTSASSPACAGVFALLVERFGAQGNPNPRLYQIANQEFSSGGAPAVFHDVTQGDNSVPGAPGFAATPGFDEATGLGSIDARALLANWLAVPPPSAPRPAPVKINRVEPPVHVRPFR